MALTKNLVNVGDASITGDLKIKGSIFTDQLNGWEYKSTLRIGGSYPRIELYEENGIDMESDGSSSSEIHLHSGVSEDPYIQINSFGNIYLDTSDGDSNIYLSTGNGTVVVSNSINSNSGFFQTSDIRKKDIISDISLDKAYNLIDKCQTILYTLKNDESKKEEIGLIAQEVQEFFPEIVSEDKEGNLSLDYAKLTVVILKVLKDVINRVKKLEKDGSIK